MADITISLLPLLPAQLSDELEIQRTAAGESGKIRVSDIVALVPAASVAWGDIVGTLSNQTDLQAALDAKTDVTAFNAHTGDSSIHYTQASIRITESQISDFGSYLPIAGGALSGPLITSAGTVTAPAIAFAADTNTGFYRVSEDVIGVAINGTLIATFSAAGIRTTQDLQAFQTLP